MVLNYRSRPCHSTLLYAFYSCFPVSAFNFSMQLLDKMHVFSARLSCTVCSFLCGFTTGPCTNFKHHQCMRSVPTFPQMTEMLSLKSKSYNPLASWPPSSYTCLPKAKCLLKNQFKNGHLHLCAT